MTDSIEIEPQHDQTWLDGAKSGEIAQALKAGHLTKLLGGKPGVVNHDKLPTHKPISDEWMSRASASQIAGAMQAGRLDHLLRPPAPASAAE